MGIFKANDIRGIFPYELTPEICYRIGFYLPQVLKSSRILIGRDARLSSPEVYTKLSSGIIDAGADVVDIGICDTPAVYFTTVNYGFSGSIMITASHNPSSYNGLKISGYESVPVTIDTGLDILKELIKEIPPGKRSNGKIEKLNIEKDYVKHISMFARNLRGLSVVFDASNGSAGVYLDSVFSKYDIDYSYICNIPDGTFPIHGPNPLEKKSWIDIRKTILKKGADIGVMFDGDGDRAIFFDENGKFISPDIITSLMGNYFFRKDLRNPPVMYYDLRSSRSVEQYISKLGGVAKSCPTGHGRIKKLLRETNSIYAGELSGHYYFKDNYFCDSGFIAAIIVLSVLNNQNKKLSELVKCINPYAFSGEINFKAVNPENTLKKIRNKYSKGKVTAVDGIKVEFKDWWFILRLSGAEPILRLVVEAETKKIMRDKVEEISNLIVAQN